MGCAPASRGALSDDDASWGRAGGTERRVGAELGERAAADREPADRIRGRVHDP
jgi:hypothetical protein